MAKGRATRDVINDDKCNEMREQRDKKRQNKINKPCSHPRAMKKRRKLDHQNQILKTKTNRDYRRQTNDEEDNINDN